MEGYNKRYNIYVTEGPEEEDKEGRNEKALEKKMAKNFSNMAKNIKIQPKRANQVLNEINQCKAT